MPPTNITLEHDIALLKENRKEEITAREVEKLQSNISELSGQIAAAFLAEKNKNNKTRANPSSTFGNILTQLTKFVTLSPKSPQAETQLAQNRKILDVLQEKYYSLLRDENAPISAHQQRVMGEVAQKISTWVESISREADRKLVENRTLRVIVEEAAAEVEAQTAIIDKPKKVETRKPILRTQSEIVPADNHRQQGLPLTATPKVSASTAISNIDDVYDWANWMVDAMATAEEWRSWIQKTVEETKSMNEGLQPASQTEWTLWKNSVADEAVKLIKRKKEIQDTAPSWAKDCCETMVARDFALNSVATCCRSPSRSSDMRVKILDSETSSKKKPNTGVKAWTRQNLAAQHASVKRLSGQNLVPPAKNVSPPTMRQSSRQNLAPPAKNVSPPTMRQSSRQNLVPPASQAHALPLTKPNAVPLTKDAPLKTTRALSRLNLAPPRRDAPSIVPRQNVPPARRDVAPIKSEASPKQNVAPPAPHRNTSPVAARQNVTATTRSPSPQSTKLQPRPNVAKITTSSPNQLYSKPKKPEAVKVVPVTRLSVRPRDNERRSIYATEYTRKPNASKNTKPVAAPKISSMSNPAGSLCLDQQAQVRRPRSPYSVPQTKCPVHVKDAKAGAGAGQGFPVKTGNQSPRKNSPQREIEVKITSKAVPKGKEDGEKGSAMTSRFAPPRVSIRTKQDVMAMNATFVPAKRLHK